MNYKHLDILKSLNNSELKKLNKYIESPYFNESRIVRDIHKYFSLMIKSDTDENYSKELLYEIIYPNEKFNESRLRKMISLYTHQLENFLVYHEFSGEADNQNLLLMRSLRNRNLRKILGPLIESTISTARKRKVRSYDDYVYLLKLQDEEYSYTSSSITGEDKKEWFNDQMRKFAEVTELSIVASTLSAIQVVHYHNVSVEDIDREIFMKDEVLNRIENSKELNYKKDYHYIYSKYLIVKIILDRTNKQLFKDALGYLTVNEKRFAEGFVFYALTSLYILATDQVTYGHKDFSHILVDIFTAMDRDNILGMQPELHYIFFIEMTNACIYCDQAFLAEKLVKTYSSLIDPLFRKSCVNICKALICSSKKNYAEALKSISKIEYPAFFLYMEAKILQSKIFFLQGDIESVYSLTETVGQYFRRSKDLPSSEETLSYRRFFENLRKLTKFVSGGKKDELEHFKNEINNQKFYNHDWITSEIGKILSQSN